MCVPSFPHFSNADGPEKWHPHTRETADHSLPYGVAVALIDGRVDEAQFTVERICRRNVQDLMRIIQVRENPNFTAAYPEHVSTRIAIAQEGCPVRTCQVDYPRGHARNPMTRQEIDAKFLDLVPLGVAREIPSQHVDFSARWERAIENFVTCGATARSGCIPR